MTYTINIMQKKLPLTVAERMADIRLIATHEPELLTRKVPLLFKGTNFELVERSLDIVLKHTLTNKVMVRIEGK